MMCKSNCMFCLYVFVFYFEFEIIHIIYQTGKTVFGCISKDLEEKWKYDTQQTLKFLEMCSNTVGVFDISTDSVKTKTKERT